MSAQDFKINDSMLYSTTPLSANRTSTRVKTENSIYSGSSGQGHSCDKSTRLVADISPITNTAQLQTLVESLYYGDWQAQKIIDIPVGDMLREKIELDGLEEGQEAEVFRYQESLNFEHTLQKALRMERLYGGAVIFMGLKDSEDKPENPIDFENIGIGDLLFLNAIPRTSLSQTSIQTNPILPDYGKPKSYILRGQEIHKDRLLIFNGNPLDSVSRSSQINGFGGIANVFRLRDGFGVPILIRLYNDLMWATGSRQSGYHLIQKSSVTVYKGDTQSPNVFKGSESRIAELAKLVSEQDMYRAVLLNSVPGNQATIENLAANFGSVPELMLFYLQTLSAASDIPATRFLGQAPGGLNATGDSDLENYYNAIGARQRNDLEPRYKDFLRLLLPSVGIKINVSEVTVRFKELWNVSEEEQARSRQLDTQNIVAAEASGIISQERADAEFTQRDVMLTKAEDFPPPTKPLDLGEDDENLAPGVKKQIDKIAEE